MSILNIDPSVRTVRMISNQPIVQVTLNIIKDGLRPNRSTIHPAINVPTKAPTGTNTCMSYSNSLFSNKILINSR